MTTVPAPYRIGEEETYIECAIGSLTEKLAVKLAGYLESAEPLLFSPGTLPDPFSDSEGMRVRVGVMTDGTWVWNLAWSDYVQYHRVAPPAEFIRHAESLDFVPPEISEDEAMRLTEAAGLPIPD
ncbi:hypothetical protein BKI49_21045 [Streptomyces sp. Tue6028]|uniref:hypothetical protein n=1 Tax=Streptomyces sp. Tue6028 TaxID=2036037 RepID=UPI000BB34A0B|nr:hypothetical protein [Streptomyces sp. Tue6028]PBC62071.1 hypothetical protein BKI49_21045 [Streptomyces sp. Tue6028]